MKIHSYITISKTLLISIFFASAVIVTGCGEDTPVGPEPELRSESYNYAFNEGQLLGDPGTAYNADTSGSHPRNLTAMITIDEMENGNASVTVTLNNTIDGMSYPFHAHDAADPSTTPNGTPYNETPNENVIAGVIEGNGAEATLTNESDMSYTELVEEYEGFFVVHDPTQDISTTNLATYLILGVFAQDLEEGDPMLKSLTFEYDFNEGQLFDDPNTAYEGDHARDLTATLTVEELIDGRASVTVTLNNTIDGEAYAVHSHDAADPDTTQNGTPYDETPNPELSAGAIDGTGGEATLTYETDDAGFFEIIKQYEGFFVVHDPLQPISTTDVTTYLILGVTAR